ncbi:alpha/beta hydrolase [Microbacterium sp. zg.B48]|uniref:alpha/beta fold hydrolase n=1 Tax=Microbacterium sp. zg.B48 TaxID=2969408 RepID=UPI00214B188C|nr:alpha/beta hydrolase [Microbacterium sp. zg.B48]MCR2762126.1 alpha/beta hydrolase [Microbacterium sp. zg.B48]
MHIILVPGLWLDASSWDEVTPALEQAGHRVHPLTMPGVGEPAEQSSEIGIADWISAVVDEIDRAPGKVMLVGHSGGGNVVYGAADARPEKVARIVYVDTFPPGEGSSIWDFPVVAGVVPFPGWDTFEQAEVADLDARVRASLAERMLSVPARVPSDPLSLRDERRRRVPTTMLTGAMTEEEIRGYMAAGPAWAAELTALDELEIMELGSGHWPQFSMPDRLAAAILTAVPDAGA